MSKPSLRERLAYSFDNSLARGPVVIIAYLALLSIGLIVVLATLVWATGVAPEADGGDKPGFVAIAWMALMRTLDSGTMGGDTGSWSFLLAMLAVTFGGIFVISTFIGTLTTAIEAKLDALRKGRSRVLESGHTVILGWSPRVFSIVSELVMTFMFLLIILGATDDKAPKGFAGIAIGLALTLIHLISIPVTNTSVNPARSISQALFVGDWALAQLWLFIVVPIAGAVLAGLVYKFMSPSKP